MLSQSTIGFFFQSGKKLVIGIELFKQPISCALVISICLNFVVFIQTELPWKTVRTLVVESMKNHVQNRCQKYGNISSRLRLCMYSSGSIVHTREWERRHILFSVFLLLATVLFRIPYFLYTNIKTSEVNGVASTKQCNVTCLNIVFEDSAGTLLSHKQTPLPPPCSLSST